MSTFENPVSESFFAFTLKLTAPPVANFKVVGVKVVAVPVVAVAVVAFIVVTVAVPIVAVENTDALV